MVRLGLHLSLRSGREALIRLLVTALAVTIGVTVLLGVFADYHAFQVTSRRPAWEKTQPAAGNAPASREALWNYSENIYKGRFIEQLDVAPLGPGAPVVPGIPRLPESGQYYASPALSALLRTVPSDELGGRFPGTQVGTIGDKALSGPDELAIIVGYTPTALAALPNTIRVDRIATGADLQGTTNIYRLAFGLGAIAVLFPLLILINTATRLAAARREERYAALRLVGATPRQVGVIATVDAVVGAAIGALAGAGLFVLLRPALADVSFSGVRFFSSSVTPTLWGYAVMLVGVPAAAAVASLLSLRRVQISPLGVSRKVTPKPPTVARVIPLLVGIPLFVVPVLRNAQKPSLGPVFIGLFLIMVGLVTGGSWLTMQAARLLPKISRGPSSLLAARRLSDSPKLAFRTASGLVLAVFVGTMFACLVPALHAAGTKGSIAELTGVLRVPYTGGPTKTGFGLPAQAGATLLRDLGNYRGTTVIPIFVSPQAQAVANAGPPAGKGGAPIGPPPDNPSVIGCTSLAQLPVLGTCPPGVTAVETNVDNLLFTDNPILFNKGLPAVTTSSQPESSSLSGLSIGALLIKTPDTGTLERVRTFLTTFNASVAGLGGDLRSWQMGSLEPQTFGEVAKIRNNDDNNVLRVVLAGVALTLIVAGCSLAVTIGGSLVDRKRPFTLLRVSGTPLSTLYRVVLLESALPLVLASLVAAATGVAIAEPVIKAILTSIHGAGSISAYPPAAYYATIGAGLAASLAVIAAAMPLLGRITAPDSMRFE
jgi:hypothetical protein